MSDNVVELDVVTTLPVPSERILKRAIESDVQDVVIIGYKPGGEFYFASSSADGGDVLWLIELAKRRLLDTAERLSGDAV